MEKGALPNYSWIKFQINALSDPDIMTLTSAAAGLYLKLYLMAGESDAGGLICNTSRVYSEKDISWRFHMTEQEVKVLADELRANNLLAADNGGLRIVRFMQEQGPGKEEERAGWRERQQKHRDKLKLLGTGNREEEEERRGESHRDVTVTQPPTAPPHSPSFQEQCEAIIRSYTQEFSPDRLTGCIEFYRELAKDNGWRLDNLEAVVELYEPGKLEERKERVLAKENRGRRRGMLGVEI